MNEAAEHLKELLQDLIGQRRFWDVRATLRDVAPADVADTLSLLEPEQAALAFRLLPREHAGDAFSELEPDRQKHLIEELGASAQPIVEAMDPDDRAALLDELPPKVARRLLAALKPADRRETQAILGYPPESVGRLMTPDYVRVKPDWTIGRVLRQIRRFGSDAETISYVYVTDSVGRLIDDIRIRKILLADPDETVESVMDHRFETLSAFDDREEAVRQIARYDRFALPVVDSQGVLVGIVTADDVADVAEEEATEDIQKLAGMDALEEPYMRASVIDMVLKRGPWLLLLFLGQMVTVAVLGHFEMQLAAVLALFIPMIISTGGNTGGQAATLLIRALALQELGPTDWLRVVHRELLVGIALGLGLGLFGFLAVLFWYSLGVASTTHPVLVAISVGLAILGIVLWAVVLGAMLPLVLQRLGFDPATVSSPMVATLMDVSGLVIYMTLSVVILRGTVL
ncbi:MAG: magnesium transporter [Acidobacteria bacterium]|jgi:magnesium transporter|nr:magnesium transporter [Acidobacteriota bacterium]